MKRECKTCGKTISKNQLEPTDLHLKKKNTQRVKYYVDGRKRDHDQMNFKFAFEFNSFLGVFVVCGGWLEAYNSQTDTHHEI